MSLSGPYKLVLGTEEGSCCPPVQQFSHNICMKKHSQDGGQRTFLIKQQSSMTRSFAKGQFPSALLSQGCGDKVFWIHDTKTSLSEVRSVMWMGTPRAASPPAARTLFLTHGPYTWFILLTTKQGIHKLHLRSGPRPRQAPRPCLGIAVPCLNPAG